MLNNTIYFMKKNGELDTLYRKWTDTPLPPLETLLSACGRARPPRPAAFLIAWGAIPAD